MHRESVTGVEHSLNNKLHLKRSEFYGVIKHRILNNITNPETKNWFSYQDPKRQLDTDYANLKLQNLK